MRAVTPPSVSGMTPGALDAAVIAVRRATRDRSAPRSTLTMSGSLPASAVANAR
jgi:hypothetical protein